MTLLYVLLGFFIGIAFCLWLIVIVSSAVFVPDVTPEEPEPVDTESINFAYLPIRCGGHTETFVVIFDESEAHRVRETVQAWADDPDLPFTQQHADHISNHIQPSAKGVC